MLIIVFQQNVFSQTLPSILDPFYTQPVADPLAIPKFVNPLPVVPRLNFTSGATTDMYMGQGTHDFGLGVPTSSPVFGYSPDPNTVPFGYLGPTILAYRGNPVNINWYNQLGNSYPANISIDTTLHWAYAFHMGMSYSIPLDGIPAVPHLHGGNTESASDGLPEAWWTPSYPSGPTGMDFVKTNYVYDNDQEAATIWYHDHTLGITRLNVYNGLAAFYLLRDNNEMQLINSNSIPSGNYEREIVIQDKMFYPDGKLAYPDVPHLTVPGFAPWPGGPSNQPEFFGEVIVVNGKAWPVLDVEPRKYRFRMLNGSDSRFYNLRMTTAVNTTQPLWWTVIGTDNGFLNAPVSQRELLIGTGERYDVVVDFSDPALLGQIIIVRNNAKTPFPNGATVNPNTTGQIMAFRVGNTPVTDPVVLPANLRPLSGPILPLTPTFTRKLMLFEGMDEYGRLQPMLGIVDPTNPNDGTMLWDEVTTELPTLGSNEMWEIYNATMDAHPMHIHLVKFQIVGRQKFTATIVPKDNTAHNGSNSMGGKLTNISLKGKQKGPGLYEAGWKDTGLMYPGEVTRVVANFNRPGEYVWHCHILSHEDHEMMRRFEVIASPVPKDGTTIAGVVEDYNLDQNYPNPFNPTTNINFNIPASSFVSLKIYDSMGEEVGTLINQVIPEGKHTVNFDASGLSSGVYFYTLVSGNFIETKKMVLMK
jgi:spore coat protein A